MRRRVVSWILLLALGSALLGSQVSAAPIPGTVRFSATGDFSSNATAGGVLDTITGLGNDLHLTLGDLSYGTAGTEQAWCDFVKSHVGARYPFELVSGNHESNGLNGNINDFSACLPNQLPGVVGTYGRQWYVDVPAVNPIVRFVMISPGLTYTDGPWSYAAGTPRYAWTEQAIDGARTAAIPWVVVGMHKPCLTVGDYACDPGPDIINLLLAKRVDLVLSGHEHTYQRSKQLRLGPDCAGIVPVAYNPACVADAGAALQAGAGTVLTTVGTGGVSLYNINPADPEAGYFAATSGLNQNPTYGVLDLSATADRISASFVRASGGTFADSFTISKPVGPVNAPPVAAFTSTCANLSCTFDASASSDSDGTVASYAWAFGDGGTAAASTATHSYAAGGTYTATLTVTDDKGATAATTRTVTVSDPQAPTTYVLDPFTRTVANGFGSAPTGGPYTLGTAAGNFAVTGGVGAIKVAAAAGPAAHLAQVSAPDTDLRVTVSTDKPATGGGLYLSPVGRRVVGAGDYRAKVRLLDTGAVSLALTRMTSTNTEVTLQAPLVLPGLTYAVGDSLSFRLQVTGGAPTTIRAKVWKTGTTEPAGWQRSVTDGTAGLQGPGSVSFATYLSGTAGNAPITVRLDDLTVTAP